MEIEEFKKEVSNLSEDIFERYRYAHRGAALTALLKVAAAFSSMLETDVKEKAIKMFGEYIDDCKRSIESDKKAH